MVKPYAVMINGVFQMKSHWIFAGSDLEFTNPPPAHSDIRVHLDNGDSVMFNGTGKQTVFNNIVNEDDTDLQKLIDNVRNHRNNPAVKDLLEQLTIVTNLL